jgi:hypothetical protein
MEQLASRNSLGTRFSFSSIHGRKWRIRQKNRTLDLWLEVIVWGHLLFHPSMQENENLAKESNLGPLG